MTQHNTLNVKLSNFKINKLKSGMKNNTEVALKISSNVIGDSHDENNFPHKLLLTNTQVSRFCKAFANNSSADIKLSKSQLHKIGHSGGFLDRPLELLLKNRLPLIGKVIPLLFFVLIVINKLIQGIK